MNFIDAHMIWHDFVDCLANQRETRYWRESLLPDSPAHIVDAFKLCIAHMVLLQHVSNDEFQQAQICSHSISLFVPDRLIDDYEKSVLSGNNTLRTKAFNNIYQYTLTHSRNSEIDAYIEDLLILLEQFKTELRKYIYDKKVFDREYPAVYADTAIKVYKIANIPMKRDDIEYFWTIDQLKNFSKNPRLYDLFPKKYTDYLFSDKALR